MTDIDCPPLFDHFVTGDLGVFHLKRLWSRCVRERSGVASSASDEWALDNVIYHGLNLPIEETIQYLYCSLPMYTEFERWVVDRNGGAIHANSVDRINAAIEGLLRGDATRGEEEPVERPLSHAQLKRWQLDGYLVVPDLFDPAEVKAAADAVWQEVGADPGDPESWYRQRSDHGIMIQFFHNPALEAIRRAPKLKSVFAQLWKTNDLWISTDRVSFNPPERPGFEFRGPHLHWDVSLELPIPFGIQGLVYLEDTAADQGAFTCVPGFHTRIESWLKNLPPDADPRNQNLHELGALPIAGNAGDLVIWHQALPHGSSPNRATRPRIVEYVTMFPADVDYAKHWK